MAVVDVSGFWLDRRVLVTGAAGLLGGWLVQRLLAEGADVVALVRDDDPASRLTAEGLAQRVIVARGDVADQVAMERVIGDYEVTVVFHLAAQTIVGIANRNPISTFESNIKGTWATLEACRRSPLVAGVVMASSDKAYGDQPVLPYTEDTPLQGRHPYDVSKSCADLIAASYASTWAVPVCVTRCGNFYGGGDLNWNRLVPGVIRDLHRGRRPVIRSDGSYQRDYIYVEDGAAAYLATAEALVNRPELAGRAYNFSDEKPMTVLEMVAAIQKAFGSDVEPDIRNESSHEILSQYLDSSRARSELGWKPEVGLDEGLRRTVAWYRDHLNGR